MIVVEQDGEVIAQAKNVRVVDNYFRFKVAHNGGNDKYLNKKIYSKRYDIFVKLTDNKETTWQKNQSIIFLKQPLEKNQEKKG